MIALLLFIRVFWLEGINDRFFEVYKWNISRYGVGWLNPSWNSYNPMAPERGIFGAKRDQWHWNKLISWTLIFLAFTTTAGEIALWGHAICYTALAPILMILRGIVFEASLNAARKKYIPDTEV